MAPFDLKVILYFWGLSKEVHLFDWALQVFAMGSKFVNMDLKYFPFKVFLYYYYYYYFARLERSGPT